MVIEKGALVAGRYRLIEEVGSGAMGVVWKAQDERLGRIVAIKRLLVRYGLSDTMTEEVRRRAMREARIAARLQHRNAIALFDVAEDKGDPILVMEFLPSKSLSVVLSERGTLPPHEAAEIGAQVAEALAAAHAVGIAHRDIKPGNILLAENGTVKITDFGISRALDDGTVTTQTGMLAGTPAYLAPEIARGDNSTRASDVFSLGSTLYHAIEGRPPFGTNSNPLALLHAVAGGKVPSPRNAGALEPTLMSLMRVEPGERPSMKEAAEALATAATVVMPVPPAASGPKTPPKAAVSVPALLPVPPQPTAAFPRPQSQPSTQSGPSKRNMMIVGMVALVVLAGTLVTVLILNSGNGNNDDKAQGDGPSTTQQAGSPPSGDGGSTTNTTKTSPPKDDSSASVEPTQVAPPPGVFIGFTEAGQIVIDYYGNASPDQRWDMLSPFGQAKFGSKEAFLQYWSQYPTVSSEDANVVSQNPDGSRDVACVVTYAPGVTTTKTVRVTMIDGNLRIDSEAK